MRIGYLSTAYHTSHILKKIVKAEWRLFSTGMEMMRAFKDKKIDVGYAGLTPVIYGKNKGLEVVCIAGGHVEGTFIAGRSEKAFPECLEGSKVGTLAKGTIHDVILRGVKFSYGIDFEVVNYNFSEMVLNDFIDGHVDFVCGLQIWLHWPRKILQKSYAGLKDFGLGIPAMELWLTRDFAVRMTKRFSIF
jgi:NitT/TauT family transport system substrate-binding protein